MGVRCSSHICPNVSLRMKKFLVKQSNIKTIGGRRCQRP